MSFACHPGGARRAVARGIRRLGLLALPTLLCSAAPSSLAAPAHPRVDSNDKKVNPNLTVLEWLNRRPGFEGRVAAFGSGDVLPFIVAAERMAVMGPGTPALGVRDRAQATQSQLAATVAALLGEDFRAASPRAAAPLPDLERP